MKYKYIGLTKVHLPQFDLTVEPEDIVEVKTEINHPNFELVPEEIKKFKKQKQEEEIKE